MELNECLKAARDGKLSDSEIGEIDNLCRFARL